MKTHIIKQKNPRESFLNFLKSFKNLARLGMMVDKQKFQIELLAGAIGSKSQFLQDLFVLKYLDYKERGYFVEFGAADGISGSNTYLLEKNYGWKGILAEPARTWHEALRRNRCSVIDCRCVWRQSGAQIDFLETDWPLLSTASEFRDSDEHGFYRKNEASRYKVETVSLNDLLEQNKAPERIDYLSLDTEGSELSILSAFDFSKYRIEVITCEHNFSSERTLIQQLLKSKGYRLVHPNLTDCDDWFILDK